MYKQKPIRKSRLFYNKSTDHIYIICESYQLLVVLIKKEMSRNTSVSLGNHFEEFVIDRISEGRFTNVSEVIRAGLRLLEEEETRVISLKKAIKEGIDSGVAENFDAKKHLESLKASKRKNG
jgi:antitoxin ParD1/3/4